MDRNRTLDALCHLLALAGLVGIPFGNVLAPLILWIVKKDQIPSVVLLPAVLIVNLVFVIIAGVKASQGEPYRYPSPSASSPNPHFKFCQPEATPS